MARREPKWIIIFAQKQAPRAARPTPKQARRARTRAAITQRLAALSEGQNDPLDSREQSVARIVLLSRPEKIGELALALARVI